MPDPQDEKLDALIELTKTGVKRLRGGQLSFNRRLKKVESDLNGLVNLLNGKEEKPGIKGRLFIAEDRIRSINKLLWISLGAVIGLICKVILEVVTTLLVNH